MTPGVKPLGAAHQPGKPIVTDDGWVIQSGRRIGQAVQLPSRRWVYRERGGVVSEKSWQHRDLLLDEVLGEGGWE